MAAIVTGLALFTVPRPMQAQDFTNLEAGLKALLDSVVAAGSTPGVSLRVNVPAMAFAWSGASGVADIETGAPLTTAHPVRIASNTKTFVAAATLRLWEEGRLGLDDPMHRWTPEEQVALAMEWGDPYGPPGEVYRYSDTGYVVLGLVVESAYGRPLARTLRELLNYDGLGLNSTWMETMEPAPTGAEERAHQYLGEVDTYDWDPSLDLYGGGGLASTPDDMAAFMRAVFTRGLYMRAPTADTMLTTVAADRGGPELSGNAQVPGVYRMGVSVRDVGGLEVYMHTGFWGTMVAYFPGQDITISVAVTQQQSRAMFRVFLDALVLLEEAAATDYPGGRILGSGSRATRRRGGVVPSANTRRAALAFNRAISTNDSMSMSIATEPSIRTIARSLNPTRISWYPAGARSGRSLTAGLVGESSSRQRARSQCARAEGPRRR